MFCYNVSSITDDETTIHGLETLIEYYQKENHGLVTTLRIPIKGSPPPPDTRRHGRTNLLHRATLRVRLLLLSVQII